MEVAQVTTTQKKLSKGLCVRPFCRRPHALNRFVCEFHRSKEDRERNPTRYAFENLKRGAAKRNKPWCLCLTAFSLIRGIGPYITQHADDTRKGHLSVDRIDNRFGYFFTNLQVLTHAENCSKGVRDYDEWCRQ